MTLFSKNQIIQLHQLGKYSKLKADIIKFRKEGKKYREICELLNCSMGSISYYALSDKESVERKESIDKYRGVKNPTKQRNRDYVTSYLESHPCVDCGNKDIRVLDFDHVRGEKIDSVSQGVKRCWPLKKLIEEIEKCEIRCANCHRIVTHERRKIKYFNHNKTTK